MPLITVITQSQAMDTARERGVEFFLLYLATLTIKDEADYRVFNKSSEAEDFLNSLLMTTQERSPRALASEAANTTQAAVGDP